MATSRKRWTREELLIALNLYHKLTFGQFHKGQPAIIALAEKLERTTSSIAMKLSNFASQDPALKLRGIKGLPGASAQDRAIWIEFHENLTEAAPASENLIRKLFDVEDDQELEVIPREGIRVRHNPPLGPSQARSTTTIRRGQEYFRDAVLNNFGGKCGVSGLPVRPLLVASHILPWATHPKERWNVRNGLCLSSLHDAAFDRGLISFDESYRMLLSTRLKKELPAKAVEQNFGSYAGVALQIPEDAALPDSAFLATHRERIYLG